MCQTESVEKDDAVAVEIVKPHSADKMNEEKKQTEVTETAFGWVIVFASFLIQFIGT